MSKLKEEIEKWLEEKKPKPTKKIKK